MVNYSYKDTRKCIKYYNAHVNDFYSFMDRYDKETLCRIYYELNGYQWDDKALGKFRGDAFATALFFAIEAKIGKYELGKYYHLVLHKGDTSEFEHFCKTEEEYDKYCLIRMVNEQGKKENPIYDPLFW